MPTQTYAAAEVATAVSAATSAASASYVLLSFTPATAALGGLLLGIAAAGKLLSTGRVLGVSGAVKGLVTGDWAPWRVAFVAGLALGAVLLSALLPTACEVIPTTFSIWRAAAAGLLVGLGSSLGNGCTSGHGICGTARLSPRSLAYTATFMTAGLATATLTDTAAALHVAPLPAAFAPPTVPELNFAVAVAAAAVAAYAGLGAAARVVTQRQQQTRGSASVMAGGTTAERSVAALEVGAEALSGCVFALGLGLSGMTRPSKVAGFLTASAPSWDPSLPFVMAAAVAVAMVAYQAVLRYRLLPKPVICPRFQIPTASVIDRRLLLGGVLFGAGWGLAGMCPGPALVAAGQGDLHVLSYLGALVGGMWLEAPLSAAWAAKRLAGRELVPGVRCAETLGGVCVTEKRGIGDGGKGTRMRAGEEAG